MQQIPEPKAGPPSTLPTRPVGSRLNADGTPRATRPPFVPGATSATPGVLAPGGAGATRARAVGLAFAAVMILAVLVAGALLIANPGAGTAAAVPLGEVRAFPDQGHTHIAKGQPHPTYETNPPVSGWHREEFPTDPNKFVYDQMMDDEVTVHLLEHGHLIAWYSCGSDSDCPAIRDSLAVETQKVPHDASFRLYVMPRATLPTGARIALGAWQHLEYLKDFDQAKVDDFVKRFGGSVQENMSLPTATP